MTGQAGQESLSGLVFLCEKGVAPHGDRAGQ